MPIQCGPAAIIDSGAELGVLFGERSRLLDCYLTGGMKMWRSFFLAIGVFVLIMGVECLGVGRVTLKLRDPPPKPTSLFEEQATEGPKKQIVPPPWAPWSLLSTGAVVCLYSFTIPRRVSGG